MRRLLFAALFLAAFAAPAKADFADGLQAYDGGDYATAVAEWRPLARQGHAGAQVALAGLYLVGTGVPQDYGRAAAWYRRAAAQGDASAQLNLGDLYARGLGIRRDLVQAYLWLDLAAAQGRQWAARRRDAVAGDMTAAEIAEAERRVRDWRPAPE